MGWFLTLLLIAIVGIAIAVPFYLEKRKPEMSDADRRNAPGDFAKLSRGLTHYRWTGAARGPVAVCVHGLTTPSFVWGPIAEGLGKLGFRVLVYDLYGRGYSDRPAGPQDSPFFVAQLEDLLESQGIEDEITLLGYSMGGAIATAYAATFPEKLRQLVLIAPAGMGHDLGPIETMLHTRPKFGRWLMYLMYGRSLRQATEAERDLPSEVDGMVDLQLIEIGYRGFVPAVVASMTGIMAEDRQEDHHEIRDEGVPVLAIWAEDDDIIPLSGKDKLTEWNGAAKHEVVENAGHTLAYTHSHAVLSAMRTLMRN